MKKAFTLIELLVVIAIIAILAAILFPVFAQAREKARRTQCISNLKNVGMAMILYADDYDETYVSMNNWKQKIDDYVKNKDIYYCPSRPAIKQAQNWFLGQAVNLGSVNGAGDGVQGLVDFATGSGVGQAQIISAGEKIMLVEWGRGSDGWGGCNAGAPVGDIVLGTKPSSNWACYAGHNGQTTVTFCDGHTKGMRPSEFHSNIIDVNADGSFKTISGAPAAVAENIWRKFWDITY